MVGSHFCQHLNGNFFITVLTIVAMLAVVDFLSFRLVYYFRHNLSISLLNLTKFSWLLILRKRQCFENDFHCYSAQCLSAAAVQCSGLLRYKYLQLSDKFVGPVVSVCSLSNSILKACYKVQTSSYIHFIFHLFLSFQVVTAFLKPVTKFRHYFIFIYL